MFEIISCHRGDDPGPDYRHVLPRLQLTRGPCLFGDAVAAYHEHPWPHPQTGASRRCIVAPMHLGEAGAPDTDDWS